MAHTYTQGREEYVFPAPKTAPWAVKLGGRYAAHVVDPISTTQPDSGFLQSETGKTPYVYELIYLIEFFHLLLQNLVEPQQ